MKKKKVLLATLLGVSAMAATAGIVTGITIANTNTTVEVVDYFQADEATNACDDVFGGNSEAFRVTPSVAKASQEESSSLVKPVIGRQFVVEDGLLYIRYYAAITSLDTNAVWTKNLYTSDGTLSKSYGTTTSEYAYTALQYTEEGETKTYSASDVEAEDGTKPFKYFVTYTIKGIPVSTYSEYYFDAYVTLSNDTDTIISKTGTVKTDSDAAMSSYELDIVDTYNIEKSTNSSAGNGEYITQKTKTIYTTSDTALDTSSIVYLLNDELTTNVTVSGFSAGQTGKQTITVSTTRAAASYDIYVVSGETETDEDGNYLITVDQSYTGEIGEVVTGKGNMFTTISQALEFIQNTGIIASTENKILNIGAGYYNEKLEINTPNIKIVGASSAAHGTYSEDENYSATDYAASTIIEYDSLYGIADDSGFVHTTDSTATVAIRDDATNVTFENVTISNAYNCKAYFDATLGENYKEHRALALLVQSDQFIMKNCSILGYQDTLELFTGRQYFNSCYISGTTDYIFGTNSTTLFDNCTIHTVYNGSSSAGGYIIAFKGYNQGASDAITYGAIFSGCTLEGDSNTVNVSLGRPWGEYANVAFIGCDMASCISTTEYTEGSTAGQRYVTMSEVNPTDENVKFVEYGNTGAGAVSESQNGMTYLDATTAAKYTDYKTIFGSANGYPNVWNYETNEIIDTNVYYYFDGTEASTGSYSWTESASTSVSSTIGDLTIDTKKCQYYSAGYTEVQPGTMTLTVSANARLTITTGYNTYSYYNITGSVDTSVMYASQAAVTYYFEEAQTVTITFTGKVYLLNLILNYDEGDPSYETTSITVSGKNTAAETGDTIDTSSLTVYANTNGGYKKVLNSTEYDVSATDPDGNAFDLSDTLSTAGTYTVKVALASDDSVYATYSVVVTSAVEYISTSTSITFGSSGNYSSNSKVDSTNATISNNGTSNSKVVGTITFDVQAGAKIYVKGYSGYTSYTIVAGTQDASDTITSVNYIYDVTSDSTVTITGGSNNYLYGIYVVYPITETSSYTYGATEDAANNVYALTDATQNGLIMTGTFRDASGSYQFQSTADNDIIFYVKAGATVVVTGHSSSYGILTVLAGSTTVEQSGATYSITVTEDTTFTISAGANGTQYSYIKGISITYPSVISESTTINFGSEGNYNSIDGVTITATVQDNGTNNSKLYGGNVTFTVAAGATVLVYGNYSVDYTINGTEVSGLTSTLGNGYSVTFDEETEVTIACDTDKTGDNYFYYIQITF